MILTFVILCAASRSAIAAQNRHEFSEVHMGMPVRIVLYADSDSTARSAARAAFARIAYLDAMMSDYRPDSEVRRLSASAGSWTKVSPELFDVLATALRIAEASDGAFDPTVAPFVALWREARVTRTLPSAAALDSARRLVGWSMLSLDSARTAVMLQRAGMRLDLGGIAKGYILDAASETITAAGLPSSLVESGGDIVVTGPPPATTGWRIALPADSLAAVAGAAQNEPGEMQAQRLTNAAMSSSGPVFQFIKIDGTRYSHVIDPRTGLGVTAPCVVHVIANRGVLSDGVATALAINTSAAQHLAARLDTTLQVRVKGC